MAEGDDDVRVRLRRAALKLFGDRGYDRTTAAEIAAAAGVTERTFFRHFPDKREVLFDGEAVLRAALTAAVTDAPARLRPMATLLRAFRSTVPLLEANRPYSLPRQAVIAAAPALHERELAKAAALADVLSAALRARGVDDGQATLAARTGMFAFGHAVARWFADPEPGLNDHLDRAFGDLKALSSGIDV